jgi:Protein of unknown function (DUF3987)
MVNASPNGHAPVIDPTLLHVLQRKGYAVLVADLDDAEVLFRHDLPGLNLPDVELLTDEAFGPLRTLAVLQRSGLAGEQFGDAVRQRLKAIDWPGTVTFASLPVDCPDLTTLAARWAEEPSRFQGYIIGLLADPQARQVRRPKGVTPDEPVCPALPRDAQVDAALAAQASPWLDAYIIWSRRWAPRAFDEFHEACGLFTLSTTAARRVRIDLGSGSYTSLYLAMTARTTVYTKSTAAELAVALLRRAGLGLLLAADDSTPQALISAMTGVVPDTVDDFGAEAKVALCQRLAFAAQKGWFYEEFGQHLEAMMRRDGPMVAFRSLLRRLDDHQEEYTYHTISRGQERLEKPYVTLLASLTPADLRPFAGQQSTLWRDGYFARFAFIVPPAGAYSDAEFPEDSLTYPATLLTPLRAWHRRLGIPNVDLEPILKQGKPTGRYWLQREPLRETTYQLSPEARQAFYRYDLALRGLARQQGQEDLDGSYGRFAMKALRVAALLASLQETPPPHTIDLPHWHRGQQIAERWRASLHRLIGHLDAGTAESRQAKVEEHLIRTLKKQGLMTKRDLQRRTGVAALDLLKGLDALQDVGLVETVQTAQTTKYRYVAERLNGNDPHDR